MDNQLRNVVTTAERAAHNRAMESAAAFLERTAADFDQLATLQYGEQKRARDDATRTKLQADVVLLNEKARLLRGQAGYVREMKVKE